MANVLDVGKKNISLAHIFGDVCIVPRDTTRKTVIHYVGSLVIINGSMKNMEITGNSNSTNSESKNIKSSKDEQGLLSKDRPQLVRFCKDCKKELCKKIKDKRTGYCNICVHNHLNPEIAKREIECLVCGKIFKGIRKTRKFCSKKCLNNSYTKRFKNPELFNSSHPLLQTKGNKPRLGKIVNCQSCFKEKYISPTFLKKHKTFFCSKSCMNDFQKKNGFSLICAICSEKFKTQPGQVRLRNRKHCSRKCNAIARRLEATKRRVELGYTKHQLDRLARYSPEAKVWRKAVFERDNFTCQICFAKGNYIEADHIKPFAYFPELRFELSNGRTLCRECHDKTKISAYAMRKIYIK